MPAVVRALDEAKRRSDAVRRRIGDELRQARLNAGLTQRVVARPLGCSTATVSRVERGLVRNVTIGHLSRHAAVLGLALRADVLPTGIPLRDAGQLTVINRLAPLVGNPFVWILEMPVGPHDLRAFDAGAIAPGCKVAFDVWARVRNVEAQVRLSQRKAVDAGIDRLILVFGDTRTNRQAVRAAGVALRRAFPLSTRQVLAALGDGRDPGANGIAFI